VPLDQASTLDQALSKAGIAHETFLLPSNDHAFDINWGGFGTQIARGSRIFFKGTEGMTGPVGIRQHG